MRRLALALFIALAALAGCGGSAGSNTSATHSTPDRSNYQPRSSSAAFTEAKLLCAQLPLAELARQNGIESEDPAEVAHAFARGHYPARYRSAAERGCKAALAAPQ